jgi:putative transposase
VKPIALPGIDSMSNTHLSLRIHLVWATKDRRPWLDPEWRPRLFACAATIITRKGGRLLSAGGVRDHVHLYVEPPATITIAELVGAIKANTARWIHQTFPHRRGFKWQHGYGAFTVSGPDDGALRDYIRNQEQHHRERPFAGEYLSLLEIHGIEYDLTHTLD